MNVFAFGSIAIAVDDDCRLIDVGICVEAVPLLASKNAISYAKMVAHKNKRAARSERRRLEALRKLDRKRSLERKKNPAWKAGFAEVMKNRP